MRRTTALIAATVTAAMTLIAIAFPSSAAAAGSSASADAGAGAPPCTSYSIPVSLAEGTAANQTMAGWLCGYGSLRGKAVQLLVPGFTYDHDYWNFQYQPDTYSYLRSATRAGYAVFMVDRLGTGDSSKPAALALTIGTEAWTVHQVISGLRSGQFGTAFSRVVLVGHSLGGTVSQVEASTYHDEDAVIISDWLNSPYWVGTAGIIAGTIEPAQLVPRLADRPLGYLTTLAGLRGMFYNSSDTDPKVIAQDEATRQTGTPGEELTIVAPTLIPSVTQNIKVPVLLATGQYDFIFCGALTPCTNATMVRDREAPAFSPQACLSAYVLPNAGHDINLELNAPDWFAAANRWTGAALAAETPSASSGGAFAGQADCAEIAATFGV
ncbi:MAG TPA: alpha/beta fold hydrolase [Pseudonocardiaceae bacterium]